MSASVTILHDPRTKGWSGQHLAEFRRVARSFERLGVAVDCESGLTDEGDPWFVICDASSDEVLVHFARLDARFVVEVACIGVRIEGASLPTLPWESWSSGPVTSLGLGH